MVNILKPPCDEPAPRPGRTAPCAAPARPFILAATILGSSLAFIDGTLVNVALPALQANVGASAVDVQWVVEIYALLLASLLLVGGSLGDRFGRRAIFAIGVTAFALGSAWCGLAPDIRQLILARAFQGIGAALLVPGSLAIISVSFPSEERGPAIGTWSGFTAITAAVGPVLGGWLIDQVSWRAAFFVNLPVAAIVLFLVFRYVPESRDAHASPHVDWTGAVLATVGLGSLVYGLIESSRLGFRHPAVIVSLAAGVVLLPTFVLLEKRVRHPMLSLTLFRSADFSAANALTLLLYAALGGALFFYPLNLIQVHGYSATAAGAALLPLILIMFALSRWSGGLLKRYGAKRPLVVGPVVAAVGFALFARPGVEGSYWSGFFPAVVVLGLGMAVTVAPLTTTVMNAASGDEAGIASGINNAVSRAAGLLGLAAFGVVMLQAFERGLDRRLRQLDLDRETTRAIEEQETRLGALEVPQALAGAAREAVERAVAESFVDGFRRVMLIASALAFASGAIAWRAFGRAPSTSG